MQCQDGTDEITIMWSTVDQMNSGDVDLDIDATLYVRIGTVCATEEIDLSELCARKWSYAVPSYAMSPWFSWIPSYTQELHKITCQSGWRRTQRRRWTTIPYGEMRDCWFEAMAMAIWGRPAGKAKRHYVARLWRGPSNQRRLEAVSRREDLSPKRYVWQIATRGRGARPDAELADFFPIEVFAWARGGSLLFVASGLVDQYHGQWPVLTIHMGL